MTRAEGILALLVPTLIVRATMLVQAALVQAALVQAALAQEARTHTVWDGVYTQAQADRGRERYESTCAGCHGDELEGDVVEHPELAGGNFRDKWNGLNLGDLFQRIHRDMPQNKPGSLSRAAAIDLVAFILRANGFPGGANQLPPDPNVLRQIRIDAQKTLVKE